MMEQYCASSFEYLRGAQVEVEFINQASGAVCGFGQSTLSMVYSYVMQRNNKE